MPPSSPHYRAISPHPRRPPLPPEPPGPSTLSSSPRPRRHRPYHPRRPPLPPEPPGPPRSLPPLARDATAPAASALDLVASSYSSPPPIRRLHSTILLLLPPILRLLPSADAAVPHAPRRRFLFPRAAAQPTLPAPLSPRPVVSPSVLLPSQSPRYTGHHAASLSLQHRRILLFSQSPRYTNQSTMDSWTEAQLRKMEAGGNDRLNAFLTARGNDRLNSNAAAAAYRDRIAALAEGRPLTDPPVVKETPVLRRCVPGHQHRACSQLPKLLSVEDKLRNLGCTEIGRKIAEVEMDLTMAKSEGHLWGNQTDVAYFDKVGQQVL